MIFIMDVSPYVAVGNVYLGELFLFFIAYSIKPPIVAIEKIDPNPNPPNPFSYPIIALNMPIINVAIIAKIIIFTVILRKYKFSTYQQNTRRLWSAPSGRRGQGWTGQTVGADSISALCIAMLWPGRI
jgi:hypothetical protein